MATSIDSVPARRTKVEACRHNIRENGLHWYYFLFFIALGLVMVVAGVLTGVQYSKKHNISMYGMVLDGGSVHTTVILYQWKGAKLNGTGEVDEIFSCEIGSTNGISSFTESPGDVDGYLLDNRHDGESCIEKATSMINYRSSVDKELFRNKSTVFLGATGGMRVLNDTDPEIAQEILCDVSNSLCKIGLKQPAHKCGLAKIISGKKEAKLGWVTVNYLLRHLQTEKESFANSKNMKKDMENPSEIGALDWGGASSQITFPVDTTTPIGPLVEDVTFFNRTTRIFTTSHICYGQAEALNRYFVHLIYQEFLKTGKIQTILKSPCQPDSKSRINSISARGLLTRCTKLADKAFEDLFDKMNRNTVFKFEAKNDIQTCKELIDSQFDMSNCTVTYASEDVCLDSRIIPKAKVGTKFLAFSTYWYVVDELGDKLMANKNDAGILVQSSIFKSVVESLCSEKAENHSLLSLGNEKVQNSCFRALYMQTLLFKGYKFNDWNDIRFVSTIHGQTVGWTLGYMLQETNKYRSILQTETYTVMDRFTFFIIALFILMGLCLIILAISQVIGKIPGTLKQGEKSLLDNSEES